MIISASRRTDIPAFYGKWMIHRLQEGYVLVPNPRNLKQIGKVTFSPHTIDCIVFWTKNAAPMLDKLPVIDRLGYRYYFTFTLTPYGRDTERFLPPKKQILETFIRLSDLLGPERVDWRFDPVWLHKKYSLEWHEDAFGNMCRALHAYTKRCIVNFIKPYRHISSSVCAMNESDIVYIARSFARIAKEYNLPLFDCAGRHQLAHAGLQAGSCINREKIEKITGWRIKAEKDTGQPKVCSCIESVDIGVYDTCSHGCLYCYAVTNERAVQYQREAHCPESPLLIGNLLGDEIIYDRTRPSFRDCQLSLL